MIVDCSEDEHFIAYGTSHQPATTSTTTTSSSTISGQYVMSLSSSLPSLYHHRSCDPITVLNDDQDEDVINSSDHVMSGDSGDATTTQCNSGIKRKRRKLIHSNCLVSNWQPAPITVEGEAHDAGGSCDPLVINKQGSTNASTVPIKDTICYQLQWKIIITQSAHMILLLPQRGLHHAVQEIHVIRLA